MDILAEKILAGEPLTGVRIVDVHAHALHGPNNWYCRHTSLEDGLLRQMDRLGVDTAWCSSFLAISTDAPAGNRRMRELVERADGRLRGYFVVNGNFPAQLEEEIEKYRDAPGFVGAKVYAGAGLDSPNPNIALDAPGLDRLYALAERYGFCILAHTWGSGSDPAAPNRFRQALEKYPALRIIVGHAGGDYYGHRETAALVRDYPHVYWDITGTEFGHMWLRDVVRQVNPKRILFGSDMGCMDNRHYLGMVGLADIDLESKLDILGRNADALLRGLGRQ